MRVSRPSGFAVVAVLLSLWPPAALAQQPNVYRINSNDALDRKAIVGLTRAARVARLDTHQMRLVTTDQFNAFYCGQGLFVAGKPLLGLPQWAVDAVMAHEVGRPCSDARPVWVPRPRPESAFGYTRNCFRTQGTLCTSIDVG